MKILVTTKKRKRKTTETQKRTTKTVKTTKTKKRKRRENEGLKGLVVIQMRGLLHVEFLDSVYMKYVPVQSLVGHLSRLKLRFPKL